MDERILIADDESNIRLMLRTCLELDGFKVLEAADGKATLEIWARESPSLVILDLWMPPPDGLAVLKEMRARQSAWKTRVMVLTAHGSVATAVQAVKLGAFDFLEKPLTPEALREAVGRALAEDVAGALAPEPGRDLLLWRARSALRLDQPNRAEAQLLKLGTVYADDPEYLNLVGAFHEVKRNFYEAKRFYGKALAGDKAYAPAVTNLQRIYELEQFGKSEKALDLG